MHEHTFSRIIANRPGLATLQCGCKKIILFEYGTAAELVDLHSGLKQTAASVRQFYETLAMKLTSLRNMGFRRGEIAKITQHEVPA